MKETKYIDLGKISEFDLNIIIDALEYCYLNKAVTDHNIHDEAFGSMKDIMQDCLDKDITVFESYKLNE